MTELCNELGICRPLFCTTLGMRNPAKFVLNLFFCFNLLASRRCGAALDEIYEKGFTSNKNDSSSERQNVHQAVFIITDRESSDDAEEPAQKVIRLYSLVFFCGIVKIHLNIIVFIRFISIFLS